LRLVLLSDKHEETPFAPSQWILTQKTTQKLAPSPELTPSLREMTQRPNGGL
jgi:hypothetical protein